MQIAAARQESLVWALERGSRSGRVAYQFARDYAGRHALRERSRRPDAADEREVVDVAVGVLIDADGRFLLTSRPEGKVYAGWWEFPGGKLEAGESGRGGAAPRAARRARHHDRCDVTPWNVTRMDYAHARVRLHFCKVFAWQGELEMREGQRMAWQTLPVEVAPVLPGTLPVLEWFAAERGLHVGATNTARAAPPLHWQPSDRPPEGGQLPPRDTRSAKGAP